MKFSFMQNPKMEGINQNFQIWSQNSKEWFENISSQIIKERSLFNGQKMGWKAKKTVRHKLKNSLFLEKFKKRLRNGQCSTLKN